MKKLVFKIDGMHCTGCAMNIDGNLEDTNGVVSANTNYAKQESIVEFDDKEVSVDTIVKQIATTGYTATVKD